jgi:hypothetical protein
MKWKNRLKASWGPLRFKNELAYFCPPGSPIDPDKPIGTPALREAFKRFSSSRFLASFVDF